MGREKVDTVRQKKQQNPISILQDNLTDGIIKPISDPER
jgi:hypothetical protein